MCAIFGGEGGRWWYNPGFEKKNRGNYTTPTNLSKKEKKNELLICGRET